MPEIKVHYNNAVININYSEGASLLQILQNHDFKIEAPCGGNGTCGKCRVQIKEVGFINSCEYYPYSDIEVILTGHDHIPRRKQFPFGTYINLGTFYNHQTMVYYNNDGFSLVCWRPELQTLKKFEPSTYK